MPWTATAALVAELLLHSTPCWYQIRILGFATKSSSPTRSAKVTGSGGEGEVAFEDGGAMDVAVDEGTKTEVAFIADGAIEVAFGGSVLAPGGAAAAEAAAVDGSGRAKMPSWIISTSDRAGETSRSLALEKDGGGRAPGGGAFSLGLRVAS